jgi:hypothetical protein
MTTLQRREFWGVHSGVIEHSGDDVSLGKWKQSDGILDLLDLGRRLPNDGRCIRFKGHTKSRKNTHGNVRWQKQLGRKSNVGVLESSYSAEQRANRR